MVYSPLMTENPNKSKGEEVKKYSWLCFVSVLLVASLLASCKSTTTPAATTTTATAPTTAAKTTATTTTAVPTTTAPTTAAPTTAIKSGEPQYGGTLNFIDQGFTPSVFDPADCDWTQAVFCGPVYETLLQGDLQKGPRGTNEYKFAAKEYIDDQFLTGCLAESWELTGKQIIFHIRKGVKWPDKSGVMASREFTAKDAELALNRYWVSPKSSAGRFAWANSLKATDNYTLVLDYNTFSADWTYLIGWGWACDIEPPEVVTAGPGKWQNVNGTGPFAITDLVAGASVTYTKNQNYWGSTTIGGKTYQTPFFDKINYIAIGDASTRLAALRTGKCDLNMGVGWTYVESLQKTNPNLKRYRLVNDGSLYISLRCDKAPFNDRNVRLAMSMGLDRTAIAKDPMFEPQDDPTNAGFVNYPLGFTYPESVYTPLSKMPPASQEIFTYNPDKAKKLLADAGFPNGLKTEMVFDQSYLGDFASLLKAQWLKIGVDVTLKPMEGGALSNLFQAKNQQALLLYDKGLVLPITAMRYQLPGQPWGPSEWHDPDFEKQYYIMKATTDKDAANKMIKEMNMMVINAIAYIPMRNNYYYVYGQPWLMNYYGERVSCYWSYGQIMATAWIDQKAKSGK